MTCKRPSWLSPRTTKRRSCRGVCAPRQPPRPAYPMPVLTVVVLDACDDDSASLAGQFGTDVHFVSVEARNVGAARAAGFTYARSQCHTDDPARTWYATTDADTRVDPDWLLRQLASGADMVLGVVRVAAWRHFPAAVARRYLRRYHSDGPGHNHIHGANMGFRADALLAGRRFSAAGHRRGRRPGRPVRRRGPAHPSRREAVGGDVGSAHGTRAGRLRPPPARAVGVGVQAEGE